MKRAATAARLFALAGILVLGQGAALHHDHARSADCPPAACAAHGVHVEADSSSVASPSECPFCEMLSQGRTVVPAAGGADPTSPLPERPLAAMAASPLLAAGPARTGPSPRAPPRLV